MSVGPELVPVRDQQPRDMRLPFALMAFGFVLFALPSEAVLPGPLRGNGSPARLLGLLMFACVALSLCSPARRASNQLLSRRTRAQPLILVGVMILAVYLMIQCVLFTQGDKSATVPADIVAAEIRSLLGSVAFVGLSLFIITTVRTRRAIDLVLLSILAGAAISVCIGLLQGLMNVDYRDFLVPPGFVETRQVGLAIREGFTRVTGTAAHPIEFSVLVSALLPIALHYTRFGATSRIRLFTGCVSVLLLVAVPASVSRSAIVTLGVVALIYMIAQPLKVIFASVAAVGVITAVYYVAAPDLFAAVKNLFTGAAKDPSITTRLDDYKYVGDMFRLKPWLGHGLGSTVPEHTRYLDNQWLQVLVMGGVVGAVALILLIVGGVVGITGALRETRTPGDRDLVFALAASFGAIVVSTTVFDLFSFQQAVLLIFLLYGLFWSLVAVLSDENERSTDKPESLPRIGKQAAAQGVR
ncbi:O-antigen ligase family protein [Gordonia sp. DT101]|uniref:O-antigen ligase family protein n=1 Tax=Gordonia sp. DT101 TaxID=3416545 RepID=UPI003CE7D5D8